MSYEKIHLEEPYVTQNLHDFQKYTIFSFYKIKKKFSINSISSKARAKQKIFN